MSWDIELRGDGGASHREVGGDMKRISVSNLNGFHLFRTEEWMTWERYRDQIMRVDPPTPDMERGTALHKVLETPAKHADGQFYGADGWTFAREGIDAVLADLPIAGFAEVPVVGEVAGIPVSGRCDMVEGLTVHDYKTTKGVIDANRYLDSYQWRYYLHLFGGEVFKYHVMKVLPHERGSNVWAVHDYQTFTQKRYDAMVGDLETLTVECAEFFERNNLWQYCSEVDA